MIGFTIRIAALLLVVAASTGALGDIARPTDALAQSDPDPQLELPLYNGYLGIKTASLARPVVRVFDPSGGQRIELEASGPRPSDGHWVVELRPPGETAAVMVRPGQRVEVELDGHVTSVGVPELVALTDPDADTVSGSVPAGSPGVYLVVHRDGSWLDGPASVAGATYPVQPDGTFSVDLSGAVDVRPGIWGEVAALEPGGHVVLSSFAAPSARLQISYDPQYYFYYAIARVDPVLAPVLSVRARSGLELLEVDAAIRMGGPQFAFVLAEGGDLENGEFYPEPGQRIVLEADGTLLLEEYIEPTSSSIDRLGRRVQGVAPEGSRVTVALNPTGDRGDPTSTMTVVAGPDDRYEAVFDAVEPETGAIAEAVVYPGGGLQQAVAGRVVAQDIFLYGNQVSGVFEGRGETYVEHKSPTGELLSSRTVDADPAGTLSFELMAPEGERVAFSPGDLIRFFPAHGRGLELRVPVLTAAVDDSLRVLRGEAPASASVVSSVYSEPASFYDPIPYERSSSEIDGASGADGTFELRCLAIDCAMHYGIATTEVDATRFSLQWQSAPRIGVGATLSQVVGDGTAGARYDVTAYDEGGEPGVERSGLIRASHSSALPRFSVDLRDRYPDGMAAGDRTVTRVGDTEYDIVVPPFSWQADVASDSVGGTAPPGAYVVVVALNYVDASRPGAAAAQIQADGAGAWRASFGGFNLRPGDYLELYVPGEGHFVRWVEEGVEGVEPTEEPTAVPTRGLTPVPSPTDEPGATPSPVVGAVIHLPRADT